MLVQQCNAWGTPVSRFMLCWQLGGRDSESSYVLKFGSFIKQWLLESLSPCSEGLSQLPFRCFRPPESGDIKTLTSVHLIVPFQYILAGHLGTGFEYDWLISFLELLHLPTSTLLSPLCRLVFGAVTVLLPLGVELEPV